MSALFPTQSETIARFAAGLYGVAVGTPTNTAVLAQANVFGLNQILNSYYDGSFSALPNIAVAATIINNVGIIAGRSGLNASHVAEAVAFVKAQLDAAAKTNTEGETIASVLTSFSNMMADPVFGAAARAWNTTISNNIAYTASGATADIAMAQATVPVATPITYEISADKETVAEGGSVTYTVSTTGVEPGTSLAYIVSGTGNALASTQAGVVTINKEGKGTITIPTLDNAVRGDAGSLSIKLISGNQTLVTATNVEVTDNEPPAPVATPINYTVTADKESITEGQSVTYTITTTGVEPGTSIAYIARGTGNAAASVQDGYVTVDKEGKASVTIPTFDNALFGDDGALSFKLISGNQTLDTAASVVVEDNEPEPVNPSIEISGAKQFTVNGAVTEGDVVAFTVSTTGYAAGTMLSYNIKGEGNAFAATTSGALTVGVDGKAVVYVPTSQNTTFGDTGSLVLTVQNGIGGSESSAPVVIADDDSNINTYTLTPGRDDISDDNGGNDTFIATLGGISPTLTTGDQLDGGEGYDTLQIKVLGYDFEFPEFNVNGERDIKNIEHVSIDVSQIAIGNGFYGEDEVIDAEYFDDIVPLQGGKFSTGSLEKLTVHATSDAVTSFFTDIRIHKDMELVLVGSGVAGNAATMDGEDSDIIIGDNVKDLAITLDGVGAYQYGEEQTEQTTVEPFTLSFTDEGNASLESITVEGGLAGFGYVGEDGPYFEISDVDKTTSALRLEAYDPFTQLKEVIISLDKAYLPDPQNVLNTLNDVETVQVEFDDDILKNLNTIDFSGSKANIITSIDRDDVETSSLTINLGEGNDMLTLDVAKSTTANVLTSIDLSKGGNDQINIVNSSTQTGNIGLRGVLPIGMSIEDDILEDIVTIAGLDFNGGDSDALVLDLAILGESAEIGRIIANVSHTDFFKVAGSGTFGQALVSVAGINDGDNEIVVFEWSGNTYVYADTATGANFDGDVLVRIEGTKGAGGWLNSAVLIGGTLDDIFYGGPGADYVDGLGGSDTYVAGGSNAISVELEGDDEVTVTVTGGTNDTIVNIENVVGSSGDDTITGDGVVNIIEGGAGADLLQGNTVSDNTFVFNTGDMVAATAVIGTSSDVVLFGNGADVIIDFNDIEMPSITQTDTFILNDVSYTGVEFANFGLATVSAAGFTIVFEGTVEDIFIVRGTWNQESGQFDASEAGGDYLALNYDADLDDVVPVTLVGNIVVLDNVGANFLPL